jgi:hypothetical protein
MHGRPRLSETLETAAPLENLQNIAGRIVFIAGGGLRPNHFHEG